MLTLIRRTPVPAFVLGYAAVLLTLHAFGLFPRPGLHDVSRLTGASSVEIVGDVITQPLTRWGRQQFVLEGHAEPLTAFSGRVLVNLPPESVAVAPGNRLALRGWLSRVKEARDPAFDAPAYWASQGVFSVLRVWSPESVTVVRPVGRYSLQGLAWRYRQAFDAFWEDVLGVTDETGLLLGMTLGAKGNLSKEMKELCIRAGVYHIVVVSGQNMALIVSMGFALLQLVGVPKRRSLWICAGPILFYTAVVGGDPPVTRAAVMALIGLGASALFRDLPRWQPLFLAAGWFLVTEPASLFGASFQLSFGATACVIALLPYIETFGEAPYWRQALRWVAQALAISAAIHLALWPLLVFYFHRLSLCGLLANWTIFPVAGLLMALGLAIGSWGIVAPAWVPEVIVRALEGLLKTLTWAIARLAELPGAGVRMALPPAWGIAAYYGTLFGILWAFRRRKHGQKNPAFSARRHRL